MISSSPWRLSVFDNSHFALRSGKVPRGSCKKKRTSSKTFIKFHPLYIPTKMLRFRYLYSTRFFCGCQPYFQYEAGHLRWIPELSIHFWDLVVFSERQTPAFAKRKVARNLYTQRHAKRDVIAFGKNAYQPSRLQWYYFQDLHRIRLRILVSLVHVH